MRFLTEMQIQFRCLFSANEEHLYRNALQIEVYMGTARCKCLMRVLIEMQIQFRCLISNNDDHLCRNASQIEAYVSTGVHI